MSRSHDHTIRLLDETATADAFRSAEPFPYFCIDDFLDDGFAREVSAAWPTFEAASAVGRQFTAVNERLKVQVTDPGEFPEHVARLAASLSSAEFMASLGAVTGIDELVWDPEYVGGGMHLMSSGARLDVHVDFNLIESRELHRRLNILLFLNREWRDEWEGQLELWDAAVKRCYASIEPRFNRCVVFATSETSFHGVREVLCPAGMSRNSFAAYYYTREPPPDWSGGQHSTVFRARPGEWWRGGVLMPAERASRALRGALRRLRRRT